MDESNETPAKVKKVRVKDSETGMFRWVPADSPEALAATQAAAVVEQTTTVPLADAAPAVDDSPAPICTCEITNRTFCLIHLGQPEVPGVAVVKQAEAALAAKEAAAAVPEVYVAPNIKALRETLVRMTAVADEIRRVNPNRAVGAEHLQVIDFRTKSRWEREVRESIALVEKALLGNPELIADEGNVVKAA